MHKIISFFRFKNLSTYSEIQHFVSTRNGGFSHGSYSSLNTGFHVGDDPDKVLSNRKNIAKSLKADLHSFVFAQQTHSRNIHIVGLSDKGRGAEDPSTAISDTDAFICNIKGVCICIQLGDCVPILVFDPIKQVIAAIHAGWRGTLKKISKQTIEKMVAEFDSNPADLIAGIGPSNGPCCYEVGNDVAEMAQKSIGNIEKIIIKTPSKNKFIFNQWQANADQLVETGVLHENIEISGICTQCNAQDYFSSRLGKGKSGRFTAGLMLLPK